MSIPLNLLLEDIMFVKQYGIQLEILVCEQEEDNGKDSCAVADMQAGRCYCWPCPRRFENMLTFLRKM